MNLLSQSMTAYIFSFSIFVGMDYNIPLDNEPDEARGRILKPTLEYGAITGLISILFTMVMYYLGMLTQSTIQALLSLVLYTTILCWIVKNYRDSENGGFVTYGRALGIGTLSFTWAGLIGAIFSYFLYSGIGPELIDQILIQQYDQYIESGFSESMAERAVRDTAPYITPTTLAFSTFFMSAFFGFVISLIVAAIFQRTPN